MAAKSRTWTRQSHPGPYLEGGLGNPPPPTAGRKYTFFAYKMDQYFAPAAPIGTAGEYSIPHFFVDRCYFKKVVDF